MNNINYASPVLRILAKVIDFLIGLAVFLIMFLPVFANSSLVGILSALIFTITGLIYFVILLPLIYAILTANYGGSPGKMLLGLEIADEKGNFLSLKRALFRTYIGYSVSALFFGMGYFWIFKDGKRRGWQDLTAGSVVLNANPQRMGLGFLAVCGLLILNLFFVKTIAENSFQNRFLYQEIMSGFISNNVDPEYIVPSPTPKEFELMPLISKETAENIVRNLPEVEEFMAGDGRIEIKNLGYDDANNKWNLILQYDKSTFPQTQLGRYDVDGFTGKVTKLTEMP